MLDFEYVLYAVVEPTRYAVDLSILCPRRADAQSGRPPDLGYAERRDSGSRALNAHVAQVVEHILGKNEVRSANLRVGSRTI